MKKEQLLSRTLQALEGKISGGDTITSHTLQSLPPASEPFSSKDLPGVPLGPDAPDADLLVKDLLGAGGMGQVHLAWQRSLERDVAVKTAKNPRHHATIALIQEGRVMGQLEHPNIIPVHALGADVSGNPVLVMKRIDGVTWSDLLQHPEHEAWSKFDASDDRDNFHLQVLLQLCNAVEFAHSRGVLHRDIKPSNVMLGPFGEVYLLDWGVSLKLNNGEAASGSLVGTPHYMAPEMIAQETVTVVTDVFLLGGVLHFILCGAPPNRGESLQEVFFSSLEPREYTFPEDTPKEIADICRKALSHPMKDRFTSVASFRGAVRSYLRHRGSISIERATRPKLKALHEAIQARDLILARSLFAECQFGLKLALRDWNENEEASQKLQQALVRMAQFEIANEQLANAEVLVREVLQPGPELVSALGALRERVAAKRSREQELERVAKGLDLGTGSQLRRGLVVGLGFVVAAVSALISWREVQGLAPTARESLFLSLVPLLCFALGAAFLWKKISDALTQKLVFMVVLALFCINLNRAAATLHDTKPHEVFTVDMFILSAILGSAAITTHRRIWWPALLQALGALGATLYPGAALHIFNVVQPTMLFLFAALDGMLSKKNKLLV